MGHKALVISAGHKEGSTNTINQNNVLGSSIVALLCLNLIVDITLTKDNLDTNVSMACVLTEKL